RGQYEIFVAAANQTQESAQRVLIRVPAVLENFGHSRYRRKQAILDQGDALFFFLHVQVSKHQGDMIGQLHAGRDATGLHPALQLRQKKAAPAIVAEQVISEIWCAIGAQIEGARVDLLELPEAFPGGRYLEIVQVCMYFGDLRREFADAIASRCY